MKEGLIAKRKRTVHGNHRKKNNGVMPYGFSRRENALYNKITSTRK